jgi:hypothetical protein
LFLISANAIAKYPDTGAFPEAPQVAAYLQPLMDKADEVHASGPADYPLYFYLWYYGVNGFRADEDRKAGDIKYFVVQKSAFARGDAIQHRIVEPVQKILSIGDAAVFRAGPAAANAPATLSSLKTMSTARIRP